MKIYTENDVMSIAAGIFPAASVPVARSLTKDLGYEAEAVDALIHKINETWGLHIKRPDDDELTLNDIIEMMNHEIGVDDVIIRDFITEICEAEPDKDAIIFDGKHYTYRQIMDNVNSLAAGLMKLGAGKSKRVALILSNRIEYILLYFALFYIGAYPVPVNTRWGKQEIFNVIGDSDSDIIITEEKIGSHPYGEYVGEFICSHPEVKHVVYFGENHFADKGIMYEDMLAGGEGVIPDFEDIGPDDVAMLSYTSGTTGVPKGVMLKQNDIVKISCYTTQMWRTEEEEYPFSIAPLYSAQGFLSLFIDFAIGKTFKMSSSFNPNDILKEISKRENTVVHTQPTMWSLLLNCRIINFIRFDSLKKLVVSGSLCSPQLAKQIEEKLGCTLLNAYGLIEGTSVVTMTRMNDSYDVRMNTVGRVIPGIKIKIVDEDHNELPHGEVGELVIKGYNMAGYYNNDEKTREVISEDGWLYTGDLARYYDDENICIVGRCKDMIIRGGFNVYPSDIEEYILQIDGVQNTAVVGRENDILGEEIVAFVLPKAGRSLVKNDIIRPLFNQLANYKMPDKVFFVSELPTILAGKIDKKQLYKWAKEGIPQDKQILFGSTE